MQAQATEYKFCLHSLRSGGRTPKSALQSAGYRAYEKARSPNQDHLDPFHQLQYQKNHCFDGAHGAISISISQAETQSPLSSHVTHPFGKDVGGDFEVM
jgi:hypothetical protein